MSSRVNIMEIENFLFTAKVEDLLLVNSSMWRQDDNNDKRRCQQSFNLQKSYFYFNSPSWTMDILNALFLESISLIVLISVHLKHLKKNRITSLMLLHFTISFFQNTHKVTFFVQFSLFKGHGSMVIEVIDNKTGFHFVWCCLCGGWRETAVVTPLQSEEQSRSRSRGRAPRSQEPGPLVTGVRPVISLTPVIPSSSLSSSLLWDQHWVFTLYSNCQWKVITLSNWVWKKSGFQHGYIKREERFRHHQFWNTYIQGVPMPKLAKTPIKMAKEIKVRWVLESSGNFLSDEYWIFFNLDLWGLRNWGSKFSSFSIKSWPRLTSSFYQVF